MNEKAEDRPFGGMTVVLDGDFRQILPTVPKGRKEEILDGSIKKSSLWKHVKVYKLMQNMRLRDSMLADTCLTKESGFAKWILDIRDGKRCGPEGESWEQIPKDILLENNEDPVKAIIDSTYPNLAQNASNKEYLREKSHFDHNQ